MAVDAKLCLDCKKFLLQNADEGVLLTSYEYLLALLLPPVYLFHRKQWLGFVVSLGLYCLAWLMLITIFFAAISPIPWFLSVYHLGVVSATGTHA